MYIVADTDYNNVNCPEAVLAMAVAMRKKAMSTISPNTLEFIKVSVSCYNQFTNYHKNQLIFNPKQMIIYYNSCNLLLFNNYNTVVTG